MRDALIDRSIETGSSHLLCEDYALVGKKESADGVYNIVYACVSDGCSSAPNTDLGARFLCHNFATLIRGQVYSPEKAKGFWPHLPQFLLQNHASYSAMLGVSPACMHATFWGMVLFLPTGLSSLCHYYVCGYGDGAFIETDADGKCYVYQKRYESGAPYYPLYHVENKLDEVYRKKFGETVIFTKHEINPDTGEVELIYSGDDDVATPLVWSDGVWVDPASIPAFKTMALFSDGICSFQGKELSNMSEKDKLLWFCRNYMTFPVQSPNFITRNFRFMASESRRTKTVHTDDLSCASVMLKYK